MDIEEIREELQSSFRTKKVGLKWLFGFMEFERDDFLKLYEIRDHVTEIVNKAFVERWVMYYDLTKEDVGSSIQSLHDNADYLEGKIRELRGRLSKKANALLQILEELRTQCRQHAKKINKLNEEIEEGNKGEYESDYKVRPADWLPEPLRDFRLNVYPLVKALIDVLPDDSDAKKRALEFWYKGRAHLAEYEKDQVNPSWKPLREET